MSATATTTTTLPVTGTAEHTVEKHKLPKVSHGRGGAANIGPDDTVYTDGGIVREGVIGDQGDGPYSTGRGGLANIGSPGMKPTKPADHEIIPETALRSDKHEIFHTGRGGEGNLHHENSISEAKKEGKKSDTKHVTKEKTSQAPSVADTSSSSTPSKSKKRRSLFGRSSHANSDEELDPVKRAKQEEKAAKKAEHEKKFPPPTHNGMGDKLKYKVFGRLYD